MQIKIMNDDEEFLTVKLFNYEKNTIKKEDNRRGVYYIQSKYFFNIDVSDELKSFLKRSYDVYIILEFDDGRFKKIYSPTIELKDNILIVEKLNSFLF